MEHLDETTIALFIERRLADEKARSLEHHIDECEACRQIVAEMGRSTRLAEGSSTADTPTPVLDRGARIDRYVVLDRIGAGAMGAVYVAFDPDLDRKVAVKLLHSGDPARLLREAQALARISHPGVVAVHDVGTHGEHVFIAMEYIAGGTLRTWLQERERGWRAIVGCALQVARGLAAAHAAGLVHRDVKPENILVDPRGIARIGDFGLAAAIGDVKRPSDPLLAGARPNLAAGSPTLTAPNAIVGTPAYMAPEQLAGEPATARSDQFSFCATLYEALFGVRPYPGNSIDEIVERMKAGKLAEPATDRRVPKRVRAAVVRGASTDAKARFESMADLIVALSFDPLKRRRVAVAVLGGMTVVGGALAFAVAKSGESRAPCKSAPAELARVWNDARRTQVRDAITATNLPFAADTARRIDDALSAYGKAWITQHTQACEATAVHGTQSPALLDKRMRCLGRRLIDLDAALEALAATDRSRARYAVDVAANLPSLSPCSDPDLPDAPPAAIAAEVDAVARDIARGKALLEVAAPDKAAELAAKSVAAADRLGYAPLQGEAYDLRGQAQLALGDPKATRESFERALLAATRAGDLELEARSLGNLALILRDTSPDGKIAIAHARHALAIAERLGRDPALAAQLHYVNIRVHAGVDNSAVEEHHELGRQRLAAAAPRDVRTLKLDYDVIEAKLQMNPESALAKYDTALATAEQLYGANHPQVAAVLVEMAHMAADASRPDDARAYGDRAAAILAGYPGDQVELRRIDAALERDAGKRRAILEEVVRASEASAPRSNQLAMDRERLAETLLELEDWRPGIVQIDAAIAIWEALYGGHYEAMITCLVTKAQLHAGLEEWGAVSAAAERANAIVDRGGMRELVKVMAKLLLMESYFRQNRFEEALALIEVATPAIRIALLGDPVTKLLDFYAAACEWELGRDRPRALRKAREAFAIVQTAEGVDEASLAPLRAWLAGK